MSRSYVVTGGGRGIGRAIVERLLAEGAAVVTIDWDQRPEQRATEDQAAEERAAEERAAEERAAEDPSTDSQAPRGSGGTLYTVTGNAGDEGVVERAADVAEAAGTLAGWVNNAALFRDASVHTSPTGEILELIATNLNPAVVGSAVAVRRFLAAGTAGAIVNVTSHQARQAVPGCTPYVTAKAGIEGLTRALAVEYGRFGIRVNAVAPGSVATERYAEFLGGLGPEGAADIEAQMRELHPLGRVARAEEVAAAVVHLLSDEAGFITGATVPVDGGRTVLARDPEAH